MFIRQRYTIRVIGENSKSTVETYEDYEVDLNLLNDPQSFGTWLHNIRNQTCNTKLDALDIGCADHFFIMDNLDNPEERMGSLKVGKARSDSPYRTYEVYVNGKQTKWREVIS